MEYRVEMTLKGPLMEYELIIPRTGLFTKPERRDHIRKKGELTCNAFELHNS